MNSSMIESLLTIGALAVGAAIGFWFGTIQNAALKRNKKKYESGELKSGFFVMPGSMGRIATLLLILVAIQIAIPAFFQGNIQWILSAGIILGYGWTFVKALRNRSTSHG
jgi:hypothetical protein